MKLRNKKTGEIREGRVEVIFQNNDKFPNPLERHVVESFAELNADWEDYKPAEPLIKDEKVKKLLGEVVELELTVNELSKRFDEFNKHYVELCGEEEE